jgi:hypothetical protein
LGVCGEHVGFHSFVAVAELCFLMLHLLLVFTLLMPLPPPSILAASLVVMAEELQE